MFHIQCLYRLTHLFCDSAGVSEFAAWQDNAELLSPITGQNVGRSVDIRLQGGSYELKAAIPILVPIKIVILFKPIHIYHQNSNRVLGLKSTLPLTFQYIVKSAPVCQSG